MKKDRKPQDKLGSVKNSAHRSISSPDSDVLDVTRERRKFPRENEERYRRIVDTANEGIWEIDKEARTIFVNPRIAEMLGYSVEEMLGRSAFDFLFPEDYPEGERRLESARQGISRSSSEFRYRRKDGSVLWTLASRTPKLDAKGNFAGSFAMISDISELKKAENDLREFNLELENRVQERTRELRVAIQVLQEGIEERKKAEEALKESHQHLQALSRRLVEVQEAERRVIARDLHDRVGQNLSALKLNLTMMGNQISQDPMQPRFVRLDDSLKLVDETTKLVRDLLTELRPATLDEFGLIAALREYTEAFMSRYSIKVILDVANGPFPRLDPSLETTLLRIAQEALTNVARHAQANQVTLSLRLENNSVCLTIHDNGIGMESSPDKTHQVSHGLKIMRERAEAFGGTVKVGASGGKGTKVESIIPIETIP